MRLLDGISGVLRVELTEPTEPITERLLNRKATSSTTITSLRLEATVFEGGHFRQLSDAELAAAAFPHREIALRGLGEPVRHSAPDGKGFTVGELLAAVEETERRTRQASSWFGGVDVHHVYFQGLDLAPDDTWQISWGS